MDRDDEIQFLESFREKIDQYLFLGLAPSEEAWSDQGQSQIRERLKVPHFRQLRRTINQEKSRADA